MNPLFLTTLLLFSAALIYANQSGAMYAEEYAKVENKLKAGLDSSEHLRRSVGWACKIFKRNVGIFRRSSTMLAASEKFCQLKRIIMVAIGYQRPNEICKQEGFDILVPNYEASQGLPKLRSLVMGVAKVHGRLCEGFFTELAMSELRAECRSQTHWNVVPYLARRLAPELLGAPYSHLINEVAIGSSRIKVNELIRGLRVGPVDSQLAESLGRLLINAAPATERYDTDPDQAAKDFETFLVKPCEVYVGRIGPKYFVPLAIDLDALDRDLRPAVTGSSITGLSNIADLYGYWLNYRICQLYIMPNARELVERAPLVVRTIVRY